MDAVLNHMSGANQVYGVNGVGDTMNNYFKGKLFDEYFPEANYKTSYDFNDQYCSHSIKNWNDPWEVNLIFL